MAYGELIKNFGKVRDYMREFYVYGFKSRDEFTKKSTRSYDDGRRRSESRLSDYMKFRQTPDGKNVFISIDSRVSRHNPLYKAWKTKSFTERAAIRYGVHAEVFDSSKLIPWMRRIFLILCKIYCIIHCEKVFFVKIGNFLFLIRIFSYSAVLLYERTLFRLE